MSGDGPVDWGAFAERARQMRSGLARAGEDIHAIESTGYADGGLVKATVSGEGRILDLRIDPSVIDPDDPETLSRLVAAAIDEANQGIAEQRARRLGGITEDVTDLLAGIRRGNPLGTVAPRVPSPPPASARPRPRPE